MWHSKPGEHEYADVFVGDGGIKSCSVSSFVCLSHSLQDLRQYSAVVGSEHINFRAEGFLQSSTLSLTHASPLEVTVSSVKISQQNLSVTKLWFPEVKFKHSWSEPVCLWTIVNVTRKSFDTLTSSFSFISILEGSILISILNTFLDDNKNWILHFSFSGQMTCFGTSMFPNNGLFIACWLTACGMPWSVVQFSPENPRGHKQFFVDVWPSQCPPL